MTFKCISLFIIAFMEQLLAHANLLFWPASNRVLAQWLDFFLGGGFNDL